MQTFNEFKRNQLISTSDFHDLSSSEQNYSESVNALNWYITESTKEEKGKKDDENKIIQKKLDKRVNRELRHKLHNLNLTDETTVNKGDDESDMVSISDTRYSNSVTASKKVKASDTYSKDKSRRMDNSSPNNSSTLIKNNTASETEDSIARLIPEMKIKKALDDTIPMTLNNPLKYVERLLAQNQYHFMQIAYKNYPVDPRELENMDIEDIDFLEGQEKIEALKKKEQREHEKNLVNYTEETPDMKYLFSFRGNIVYKDYKYVCNCLDWNPFNKDLLAGAYGPHDIDSNKEGLLLFWTLKNQYPERSIKTPRGLTSCNFSKKNPYFIVVADYAGEIYVYNLKNEGDKPLSDSKEVKDKHTDIVWEVKWIERPNDKNEMIVSISSDGKVKEWLLKKGLEVSDLMHMKKNTSFPDKTMNPFSKYEQNSKDTLIFRDAIGLSFDFPVNDTTIYYIALEECTINKCRISYKDTYIESYFGHQGPIYKVRCNPFDPNVFITCSYDWSIKIWTTKQIKPILTCKSMNRNCQINDIEWSPFTSTIFAAVIDDGTIEIWDLSKQVIDPIISVKTTGSQKKSVKFSRNSQVIAVGDSEFNIDIFRLYKLEHTQVRLFI